MQYFTLVVLLFLSEFLLGSLAFVFRGGIGRMLTQELKYGIEKHYNVSDRGGFLTPSVASIWDNLQVDVSVVRSAVSNSSGSNVFFNDLLLLTSATMLWCFVVRRLVRHQCVAGRAMGTTVLLPFPVQLPVFGGFRR